MRPQENTPVLPEAAAGLGRQLRTELAAFAEWLAPHAGRLDRAFRRVLKKRGYTSQQIGSLTEISPAAAARSMAAGTPLAGFLEHVEYRGRRLAKLGLGPKAVLEAMAEFDRLPEWRKTGGNLEWAQRQLRFLVVLGLNNAFHQVREAESEAFYGMFRAEAESDSLTSLVERFLAVLRHYTGAEAARFWLFNGQPAAARELARPFSTDLEQAPARLVLENGWRKDHDWLWSLPLISAGKLAGVMQFAFNKAYDWMPREQELLASAAERCGKAVEKVRLLEDLARREEQVRRLAENMVEVEEAERRRISRELHDEAGQSLLCVRLQLEMIEQDLPPAEKELARRLAEARDLTEHSIVEIRRLIAALSPAVLEQIGLAAALRQLVQRFRKVHPAHVHVRVPRRLGLPKKVELVVYRLVQECFHNISKYSGASQVNLLVETADRGLRVRIEDDGVGFDVEEALARSECYGLSGLRERVALLGGSLVVRSKPRPTGVEKTGKHAEEVRGVRTGKEAPGTSIEIELPIPHAKPAASEAVSAPRNG